MTPLRRLCLALLATASTLTAAKPELTLENPSIALNFRLDGGIMTSLSLKEEPLNVLCSFGHFLCCDRWGPSSIGERDLGMPFHGESKTSRWTIEKEPAPVADGLEAAMSCQLRLANIHVTRRIQLDPQAAAFRVTESFTNLNPNRKLFNCVQHVSIGGEFLREPARVDTQVEQGWAQGSEPPQTAAQGLGWPSIRLGARNLDLGTYSASKGEDLVISYTLPQELEIAWVTALQPKRHVLVGYLWRSAEYPWLNLWCGTERSGAPARGLEFGTTGMHRPYEQLLKTGRILDRPLYSYLNPGQTLTKSYWSFMLKVPEDFRGVAKVEFLPKQIVVTEAGGPTPRQLRVPLHAQAF